jgi:hypothetical protein
MAAVTDVTVRVELGKTSVDWKVCIAPIHDEVLIGIDLLMTLDAIASTRQGDLLVGGELVLGNMKSASEMHVTIVSIDIETTLPPLSETVLNGYVNKPDARLFGYWILHL